ATMTEVTTHGNRRVLRDLEVCCRLERRLLLYPCPLRPCRHGQPQDQPGEGPLQRAVVPVHSLLLQCRSTRPRDLPSSTHRRVPLPSSSSTSHPREPAIVPRAPTMRLVMTMATGHKQAPTTHTDESRDRAHREQGSSRGVCVGGRPWSAIAHLL